MQSLQLPSELLLDATLAEEACIPTSRRILILCKPSSGKVAGVHMIPPTLDVGAMSAGEDTTKASNTLLGTADYKAVRGAIQVRLESTMKRLTSCHLPISPSY